MESKRQLATTLARHIELALANLHLRETLRSQSIRDPLTGLFNRRSMEETLALEVARAARSRHTLSVIMLDLDRFKNFNDTFGHEAGDVLLRHLAKLLQTHIRPGDIACRYGGEEFTLILPNAPLEVAKQRTERLCELARHLSVEHQGRSLGPVTISAGIAVFPLHGSSEETLLRAADVALYRAKTEGRDRVIVAQ
jgi:diguanylate cyclase (GGDEF)-like protein